MRLDDTSRRPTMRRRTTTTAALLWLVLELGTSRAVASPAPYPAFLALRQAVPDGNAILTAMNEIDTIIPGACSAICNPWLTGFATCGQDTTTIATCACTPTFLANLQTCTTCMTTQLTLAADPQAAVPATVLQTVSTQCNIAVAGVSSTSSTTSSTTTTTTTTTPTPTTTSSTTTTTTPPASSSASPSDAAANSTTPVQTGPVTVTSIVAGSPFPTQTKATNAFAGAATTRVAWTLLALGGAAGIVGVML